MTHPYLLHSLKKQKTAQPAGNRQSWAVFCAGIIPGRISLNSFPL